MLTDPVSGLHMLGVRLLGDPPDQMACLVVKKPCRDWAISWSRRAASLFYKAQALHNPQLSWGSMRFCYARRQLGIIEDSRETFMRVGT
jgi:hypothetical protein